MPWTKRQQAEFGVMLLAMGEVFNETVSETRAEIFCRAVEDLPFDAVTEAANQHVRGSKFFPKPAELRELVLGNAEDQAEVAWQDLLRQIKRVGYLGTPVWTDPIAQRAAEGLFGSWRSLCEQLPAGGPELLGYHKQFCALYGATARKGIAGELGPGREEARGLLDRVREALEARGLPTGKR